MDRAGCRMLVGNNENLPKKGKFISKWGSAFAGVDLTFLALVFTIVLPTFSKPLKDVTLVNGKPLKLEVIVNGIPKPTVQWFKDEQLLVEPAYVQESKDKTHSVSIAETLEIHAGTYKAVAVNDAGKAETIANVDIQTKPTIVKPDDVKLISGQEFSLQVVIEGKPEPKIKWMKDKVELPASLGISVEKQEKGYLLYQKECNTNLNGTYSVTATNPAGSESVSFKVVVLGMNFLLSFFFFFFVKFSRPCKNVPQNMSMPNFYIQPYFQPFFYQQNLLLRRSCKTLNWLLGKPLNLKQLFLDYLFLISSGKKMISQLNLMTELQLKPKEIQNFYILRRLRQKTLVHTALLQPMKQGQIVALLICVSEVRIEKEMDKQTTLIIEIV